MSVKKDLSIEYEWDGTLLDILEQVWVELELTDEGLHIRSLSWQHDDPEPPTPPDPEKGTWELWNYEVVEVFLVGENGEYTEIEFGPWGHHLVLQLDGPRSIVTKEIPMSYRALEAECRWTGEAFLERQWLPEKILRVNAFAIRTRNGERQYCCHTPLPGPKPDFHQPDRFVPFDQLKDVST